MPDLFASLHVSAGALQVFGRALEVTGNNVTNASTPGYARQRLTLEATPLDPVQGLEGGVAAGELQSARDRYADLQVQRQISAWAVNDQKANSVTELEDIFPVAANSGVAASLSGLFTSFSAWSQSPNDANVRQAVLSSADEVSRSFRQASAGLNQAAADAQDEIRQDVTQINCLSAKLQELNRQRLQAGADDPAWEASVESNLEDLSELVNVAAFREPNGSVTVLLGGQSPLVVGDEQYPLASGSTAQGATVTDAESRDVTAIVTGGRLAGLLDVRNRLVPALLGDASQPGDLNRLAKSVADTVNQILENGSITDGVEAQPGVPLFSYDTTSPAGAAGTLSVNDTVTVDQLAAIDPGPPYSSNGIPQKLAALATQNGQLDGMSFVGFYGEMSTRVGQEVSAAETARDQQQQQVTQVRNLRDQISGVSLDEEAVYLLQFQKSYQAAAKTITVIDGLLETTINMIPA